MNAWKKETSKQTGKQMKTYGKLFQVDKMSIQSKPRRSRETDMCIDSSNPLENDASLDLSRYE